MKQLLSGILSLGAIALLTASCTTFQQQEPPAPTSQQPQPLGSQTFPQATVPANGAETKAGISTGLIPSTNPDIRRQQVAKGTKGRNDPFAIIPVQPTFQPKSQPTKAPTKPSVAPSKSPIAAKPMPPMPSTAHLPPMSHLPELAKAVVVLGVIQIDGIPQAIIKAPNEEFTRYVGTGQLIANGQVRVKRIDGLNSPAPVVVLEELGQEVYKQVGEGIPETPASPGNAAAVLLPDSEGG